MTRFAAWIALISLGCATAPLQLQPAPTLPVTGHVFVAGSGRVLRLSGPEAAALVRANLPVDLAAMTPHTYRDACGRDVAIFEFTRNGVSTQLLFVTRHGALVEYKRQHTGADGVPFGVRLSGPIELPPPELAALVGSRTLATLR